MTGEWTGFGKVNGAIRDAEDELKCGKCKQPLSAHRHGTPCRLFVGPASGGGAYPSKQKKLVGPMIVGGVVATVLFAVILRTVSRKCDIDWEWEWTDTEGDYYE